ncbi:hypothetical protein PIB30_087495 [Stylosanthes scabra]|uniref:Uncharacterized protein n=1 Tax=Stylosanthes scabra TaxID=79078 RepID=A0ABU6WUI2_9FABA|nr:hypothetical protein [Stylosanthes scabra]
MGFIKALPVPQFKKYSYLSTYVHVFTPVAEADGSYYLVLIDLKERIVYSLNVCRSAETIAQREVVIDKLRTAIGTILLLERHNKGFCSGFVPEPANFGEVRYPNGIPHDLRSSSGVGDSLPEFSSPLPRSASNELFPVLEERIERAWEKMVGNDL